MKLIRTIAIAAAALVGLGAGIESNKFSLFPLKTNALVLVSTNGNAEFISMNTILRQAITNGEVCALVGHQWQPYTGAIIHFPESPIPVYRVCGLCKRTEQRFEEWKAVTMPDLQSLLGTDPRLNAKEGK